MSSSLSLEMMTAYDNHLTKADFLLKKYVGSPSEDDLERFQSVARDHFILGVHTSYVHAVIQSLRRRLRTQQRIAEALGLKDRTSISQMLRTGKMDGVRLTAALHQFRDIITFPTKEVSALFGFARTTTHIKALLRRRPSGEPITAQDFSYLVGVLASDEWDAAIRGMDPSKARQFAARIISERSIPALAPPRKERRPEQHVLMLQDLFNAWADFAVLALWCIPDCIPEDDTNQEANV